MEYIFECLVCGEWHVLWAEDACAAFDEARAMGCEPVTVPRPFRGDGNPS